MCTGAKLLLLSCGHRGMSNWCVSSCGRLVKIQLLILHNRNFDFLRRHVWPVHLRLFLPLSAGLQDLLHKIPTKKFSTKKLKFLCWVKYGILLIAVIALPLWITNQAGISSPYFCKYICPQGILEGGIPLSLASSSMRTALGALFRWKFLILAGVIVLSVLFYRPFCKWLCPLGAFYSLFNRFSLLRYKVDEDKCTACGKCSRVCKMDMDISKNTAHTECIRCGDCIKACPTKAISIHWGIENPIKPKEYKKSSKIGDQKNELV